MINVLFGAHRSRWETYEKHLRAAFDAAGLEVNLSQDIDPDKVDYIIYTPNSPLRDFSPYTNAKAVLNLWAGVETIVGNDTLTMPLARMVDPGLTQGMVEWVTAHTLRHHLGIDAHIVNPERVWNRTPPPLASERSVVLLGLGALGQAAAAALLGLGFKVTGWSRSAKVFDGIECLHGDDGLSEALKRAEIAITLLPDTQATRNLINAETLAQMPQGACLINPGRGPLIDDDALLAALDAGHIAHATLDVFRKEPLPEDHPYWGHPSVTVTPHIAADTRPSTASHVIAENIRRGEAGEPLIGLVDRELGY